MNELTFWENTANALINTYGTYVDFDERFFVCPECGEDIYEDDWDDEDFEYGCPICGFDW